MIALTGLVALLIGPALVGVILCVVAATRKVEADTGRRTSAPMSLGMVWARVTRRPAGAAGRRRDLMLVAGIALGVVLFLITRWVGLIVITPIALLILPKLLGQAPRTDAALLEALDKWVRILIMTLGVGRDVTQAIRNSQGSVPPLIADEVSHLVDRLNARWPADEALHAFADALDSPEADAVVASLILANQHNQGLKQNLEQIAATLHDRLRALRAVETERAKPRQTARLVTLISTAMVLAAALFGGGYFQPYTSPLGQIIITALAAGYVASLLVMYRMTVPRPRERILSRPATVLAARTRSVA